jgi:hypothetical protein
MKKIIIIMNGVNYMKKLKNLLVKVKDSKKVSKSKKVKVNFNI